MQHQTILDSYLKKHAFTQLQLLQAPSPDLGLVVVIPSHNEKNLISALQSINQCELPDCDVEVIVVVNASENSTAELKAENLQSFSSAKTWAEVHAMKQIKYHFLLHNDLPHKHAGVGLARKIGMDEAAARLFSVGRSQSPIVCFDADSSCEKNYLREIHAHFLNFPTSKACSIYFEHPLDGEEYSPDVYEAIYLYELHLRYYRQGLLYAAAPFAFHTIGSSMAVRAVDYCKQGGMNKRKAGEDFYFLQKFIELGQLSELNSTKVIPSPRASDRVPFGTGKAILQHLKAEKNIHLSYHPESFEILRKFFAQINGFYYGNEYSPAPELLEFIGSYELFSGKIEEIKSNSSDFAAFYKRFFRWFNAFKTLKFIHFLRGELGEMSVVEAARELEKKMGKSVGEEKDILKSYRSYDRQLNSEGIFDGNLSG